jgi:iron(III) transport system ATP-binding protein
MNVLEVRNLSKRYRGAADLALRDVSLEVRQGDVLAVVGASGSGKTTLLRLVAGLEVPTEGQVLLNGHLASTPTGSVPPERRGIGIVFQDYALFPHLNVIDNVMFGLLSMRRTPRRKRALEALSIVGLVDYARRFPHELSGGQQQRVALARALAPQPSLLLLDEPFSNLDVMLKEQVREEVGQILKATRATALFVAHDLEDVLSAADRIAILKDGWLQQIDTPQAVYDRPADEYVARLFGSTNLLPGVPRAGGFDTPVGFVAAPDGGGSYDGPVTLSIRPQDLEIAAAGMPDGANGGGGTSAAAGARVSVGTLATIRQTRFRGDHQEVVVTIPAAGGGVHELLLHTRADRPLRAGDELYVRALPGAARVVG